MRVGGAAHARIIEPTREVSGPGAHERAHVRAGALGEAARRSGDGEAGPHARWRARVCGERTSSEQFRMQFDWVNFQQCLQTLQFQRCVCVTRHRGGGIACDILR